MYRLYCTEYCTHRKLLIETGHNKDTEEAEKKIVEETDNEEEEEAEEEEVEEESDSQLIWCANVIMYNWYAE